MGSVDLNSIPYDDPLSFPEPEAKWVREKTRKGSEGPRLSIPDADLTGKWVLISGANSGIGREAALQMAAWGASIILACRQPPPSRREPHPTVVVDECLLRARLAGHRDNIFEWWELNMADLSSVEDLAARWLKTGRPLDVLCNNAGMGSSPGGSEVFRTKDGFEIIHQVNFLSHVLLTLRLLPSLAAAKAPRIICTTSCFHYPGRFDLTNFNAEKGLAGYEGVQFYMNNKLWFQTWLTELQRRMLQFEELKHITVNGVHPGYVKTGVWHLNSNRPLRSLALKAMAWYVGIDSQQGSLAITNAVTSVEAGPDPAVQGVGGQGGKGGGRYFNRITEEVPMPHTQDQDARLRVWRKVNDELGLEKKGLLDTLGLRLKE